MSSNKKLIDQREIIFPKEILEANDSITKMENYCSLKNYEIIDVTENVQLRVNCCDCRYFTPDEWSPFSVVGDCSFDKNRANSYAFLLNDYCVDFERSAL